MNTPQRSESYLQCLRLLLNLIALLSSSEIAESEHYMEARLAAGCLTGWPTSPWQSSPFTETKSASELSTLASVHVFAEIVPVLLSFIPIFHLDHHEIPATAFAAKRVASICDGSFARLSQFASRRCSSFSNEIRIFGGRIWCPSHRRSSFPNEISIFDRRIWCP